MTPIGCGFLSLPERTSKPRAVGLTHVLDKGLSPLQLDALIDSAGTYVDFLKLGWGTAYVADGVKAKVARCEEAGINVCIGGTLFEIAAEQDKVDDYARWLEWLGIRHVEVSNGALAMPVGLKQELIAELSRRFMVLSEVGSKEASERAIAARWVEEMVGDVEAGATWVIAEGRESGTVGLFEQTGEVRADLVESILDATPPGRVIFETPRKDQQAWFVKRIGTNANLGNISPDEVLPLETLRCGLRADTADLLPSARHQRSSRPRQADAGPWPPSTC